MHIETQEYVPRYMAATIIAKDPTAYGFKDPAPTAFEYDEVVVPRNIDLRRVAGYTGCSHQEILELNPELLSAITPRDYILRIPAGSTPAFQAQIVKASFRKKKVRKERDEAETGLLFLRMTSSQPTILPERVNPLNSISQYGANWALQQTPENVPVLMP